MMSIKQIEEFQIESLGDVTGQTIVIKMPPGISRNKAHEVLTQLKETLKEAAHVIMIDAEMAIKVESGLRKSIEVIIDEVFFSVCQSSGLGYSDAMVEDVTEKIMIAVREPK